MLFSQKEKAAELRRWRKSRIDCAKMAKAPPSKGENLGPQSLLKGNALKGAVRGSLKRKG